MVLCTKDKKTHKDSAPVLCVWCEKFESVKVCRCAFFRVRRNTKLCKNGEAVANVKFRARKEFCTSEGGLSTERGSLFAGRVFTFALVCLLFTDFVF